MLAGARPASLGMSAPWKGAGIPLSRPIKSDRTIQRSSRADEHSTMSSTVLTLPNLPMNGLGSAVGCWELERGIAAFRHLPGPYHEPSRLATPAGRARRPVRRLGTSSAQETWRSGFTLVELLIVLAIITTLATIGMPMVIGTYREVKITSASEEIRTLQKNIMMYQARTGELPDSLDDLGKGKVLDPWGRPYQYLRIAASTTGKGKGKGKGGTGGVGKMRRDRFLVPLNSDYDLYSMGADGQSSPPLTAKASRDDIIRANDGAYIGLASDY